MRHYKLIYRDPDGTGNLEHAFVAVSLDGALEVARRLVVGEWAELHEDGVEVCRMQLVDCSGLWRIVGANRSG